jgi:hypothetical protein
MSCAESNDPQALALRRRSAPEPSEPTVTSAISSAMTHPVPPAAVHDGRRRSATPAMRGPLAIPPSCWCCSRFRQVPGRPGGRLAGVLGNRALRLHLRKRNGTSRAPEWYRMTKVAFGIRERPVRAAISNLTTQPEPVLTHNAAAHLRRRPAGHLRRRQPPSRRLPVLALRPRRPARRPLSEAAPSVRTWWGSCRSVPLIGAAPKRLAARLTNAGISDEEKSSREEI